MKIKKWQLLKWRHKESVADLSGADFVAVGRRAFARRRRLEEVTLPSTASAIKTEAFRGCRSLRRVALSDATNTGISRAAFAGCVSLETVEPSRMLSVVGERAFWGCVGLTSPTFGRDLRRIGEEAYRGCASITALSLPSSLRSVGRAAFSDCVGLESVTVADGVTELSSALFRGCTGLLDATLPPSLTHISPSLFRDCRSLRSFTLPFGVVRVGKKAFFGCTSLEELDLGDRVSRIDAMALVGTPLRSLAIPHSLKRLGYGAFGLGKRDEADKLVLLVDNEYMRRRMHRLTLLCGSRGCVRIELVGKSIEERKRERHRKDLDQAPVHLLDDDE